MKQGLNPDYWDYLVDTLEEDGKITEEQAAKAKELNDDEKFKLVNDYVSEATWERIDNDATPAVLDFLDIEYDEEEYYN